jgi:multidrug resistance efflux pump
VVVVLAVVGTLVGLGVLIVVLAITAYIPRRAADARAQAQQRRVAEMEEKERRPLPPVVITEPWLEPVDADPATSAEVLRIRLNQAETELDRITKLRAENLVSEQEVDEARFNVELRRAELAGDRAKAARVRLARAEDAFQHASKLREQKLISEDDYNRRKTELELWRAYAQGLSNAPAKPKGP